MIEDYQRKGLKALEGVDIEALSSEVSFKTAQSSAILGVGPKGMKSLIRKGFLEKPTRIGRTDYHTLGALRRCRERLRATQSAA